MRATSGPIMTKTVMVRSTVTSAGKNIRKDSSGHVVRSKGMRKAVMRHPICQILRRELEYEGIVTGVSRSSTHTTIGV
jgi:hypothetical protein